MKPPRTKLSFTERGISESYSLFYDIKEGGD